MNIAPKSTPLSATVPAGSYVKNVVGPTDAICNITFNSAGTYSVTDDSAASGAWMGSGTGAQYWVRWLNTTGTLTTGTAGPWQQLNANVTFGVSRTLNAVGSKQCIGTVEFATDSGGNNIIDSGSIDLSAIVN